MAGENGDFIPQDEQLMTNRARQGGERSPIQRSGLGSKIEAGLRIFDGLSNKELLEQQEEFMLAVDFAQAFVDGIPGLRFELDMDAEPVDPENPESVKEAKLRQRLAQSHTMLLERVFLSREGSRERPMTWAASAIEEITGERRLMLDQETWVRPLTEEERRVDGLLTEILPQAKARRVFDTAFRQRQLLAEDMHSAQEAMKRGKGIEWDALVFPDRVDWAKLFSGELGEKIDAGLRKIVDIGINGIPEAQDSRGNITREKLEYPYASGIVDIKHFNYIIKELYKACGERMDAAILSWRVASVWEIFGKFGVGVVEKKDADGKHQGYVFKVGDPPLVPDWWVNTAFLDIKRIIEGGWLMDKKPAPAEFKELIKNPDKLRELLTAQRHLDDMFFGKVGVPLSIGRGMGSVFGKSYLDHVRVDVVDENGEKVKKTFWELWWGEDGEKREDGKKVEKLGDLPWWETAKVAAGTEEAAPTGSFQFWAAINRGRAMTMSALVTDIPDPRKLSEFDTWKGLGRNWTKLGLPEEARKWFVLARMYPYFQPGAVTSTAKVHRELGAQTLTRPERLEHSPAALEDPRKTTPELIFAQAVRSGFIAGERKKIAGVKKWIFEMAGKSPQEIIEEPTRASFDKTT